MSDAESEGAGGELTPDALDRLAAEAEDGYDLDQLRPCALRGRWRRPRMIASTDMLPMVDADDYRGAVTCTTHVETIADDHVQRAQILTADERITMSAHFLRWAERLPYAPRIVVFRDEIDGREFYYRQTGWFYDSAQRVVGAFELLHATDEDDEPTT